MKDVAAQTHWCYTFTNMKKLALLLAAAMVCTAAFAQSPVGSWKGKVKIDMSAMPKVTDPKQKEMMDKMLAQVQAMTITMNVKANKTFVVTIPAAMGQPGQTSEGTWTQAGNVVTVTTTKRNGKAAPDKKPQKMTIQHGGKVMIMNAGDGPQKATITFTK